jgi:hypothetical protein
LLEFQKEAINKPETMDAKLPEIRLENLSGCF